MWQRKLEATEITSRASFERTRHVTRMHTSFRILIDLGPVRVLQQPGLRSFVGAVCTFIPVSTVTTPLKVKRRYACHCICELPLNLYKTLGAANVVLSFGRGMIAAHVEDVVVAIRYHTAAMRQRAG